MLIEDPADNAALVLKGFWQHKKINYVWGYFWGHLYFLSPREELTMKTILILISSESNLS